MYSLFPPEVQEFLMMSIRFLLEHIFLKFDTNFYDQMKGDPMGSKFSPSLANLFMSWWEEGSIFDCDNPFSDALIWYGCYIDDLLMVWDRYVAPVECFLRYVNCNICNLRFTGVWND